MLIFIPWASTFNWKTLSAPAGQSRGKNPLAQIKEKRYFEKSMGEDRNIFLIGIEFSKEKRNLTGFEWEQV
ncbi:MAG: PD-(D/E)XK nuclease domain-containing protein [Desulfotignum sp.]|nr:PD-(D/E)XK nuclease domain-containing protein [Desulfotignum sp.]MCF8087726.1 PD-(D/E)XK nuclease domain-containing protein [Desulfotignum sp.]MCF8139246.1 PD-(D/E)XK nuclease domain-containing protein [Desulfotignum sp.]